MPYSQQKSELEIGRRDTLRGTLCLFCVFVFAYLLPSDIQGFSRALVIGVPMIIAFVYFIAGLHLWKRKKPSIWKICIDDASLYLEYPSGCSFKCRLSEIKSCKVVKRYSVHSESNYTEIYLLFFDSTYRLINDLSGINFSRVLEELKKHTLIEKDFENEDTGEQYPYENFLKSKGLKKRGLFKAHWK